MLRLCPGCWHRLRLTIAQLDLDLAGKIRAEPELPEGMALLWSRVVAGQEVTRESFDPLQVAYVSVIHNCLIRWGVDAIVAGGQMGAEPPCTLGWAVGQPLSPAFDEWIWNGAKEAREAAIKLGVVKR